METVLPPAEDEVDERREDDLQNLPLILDLITLMHEHAHLSLQLLIDVHTHHHRLVAFREEDANVHNMPHTLNEELALSLKRLGVLIKVEALLKLQLFMHVYIRLITYGAVHGMS